MKMKMVLIALVIGMASTVSHAKAVSYKQLARIEQAALELKEANAERAKLYSEGYNLDQRHIVKLGSMSGGVTGSDLGSYLVVETFEPTEPANVNISKNLLIKITVNTMVGGNSRGGIGDSIMVNEASLVNLKPTE